MRLSFARRIAGTGYPFNEGFHCALLLEEARRSCDPAGTARQIAAMAVAGHRRGRLANITAPTLVIHGTDDPLIPSACGHDTALSIPNATYLTIAGMGHDLPLELNQAVAEAIRSGANSRNSSIKAFWITGVRHRDADRK